MANEVTSIGRLLVNEAIPEDMRDEHRELDKKGTQELFAELAEKHPDKYKDVLDRLKDVSRLASTEYGKEFSVGLSDFRLPEAVVLFREKLRADIRSIQQDPKLTSTQKNERIVTVMTALTSKIQDMVVKEGAKAGNAFAISAEKGFRGNPAQVTQMLFGDMLLADHKGRAIPLPGLHGYGQGVKPSEYWAGAYGARTGFIGVQMATAKTGFFAKQLTKMAQHQRIMEEDCGTLEGIPMSGDDPEAIGYVMQESVNGVPKGTVVDKNVLAKLRGKKVLMRNVTTCEAEKGICQKCAGKRDQNRFPGIGDFVGIGTGRITGEPVTQSSLGAKHIGGMVGQSSAVSGFDEINQFLQIPQNFKGAATLADADGKITDVREAPQGGWYVHVGQEKAYVPPGLKVLVERGDDVWAGDMLSSGTPNPAEVAKHKGLGAARRYMSDSFYDILKKNGASTRRRNVDILAKAFFDRVEITDPDGAAGHSIGDVVDYNALRKYYQPRKGTKSASPTTSKGMYLEQPALHYTIGTRITPEVLTRLKDAKVTKVDVHPDKPQFEPHVVRLMGITEKDPDFKVRLAGFGLKRGLIDAATHGSTSPKTDATSPTSFLMDPTLDM